MRDAGAEIDVLPVGGLSVRLLGGL
jgi:hypothetical protein